MNKKDVAQFFDRCAPWWDADMIRPEEVITKILDQAGVREGVDVLDVACGTGVLFPDYLARSVGSLTGIDISPEMVKIARSKFPQIEVLCGDVEQMEGQPRFDVVMVYNAFPHFPNPEALIRCLAALTRPGGRLSIAHSMSRAALADHHAGRAGSVSIELLHEQELAKLMGQWFDVDVIVSDERMYQVCGKRREGEVTRLAEDRQALQELAALMRFMVRHNDAHGQELADLAQRLGELGKASLCSRIMDAVARFDMLNAELDSIVRELDRETDKDGDE